MRYSIEEQELIDIADALRRKHGETELAYIYDPDVDFVVSKSEKAIHFNLLEGYDIGKTCDVIRIPNATSIKLTIAYQMMDDRYDIIYIAAGEFNVDNFPISSADWYAHNAYQYKEIIIPNTDVITICFVRGRSSTRNHGYYAECNGIDADGNDIKGGFVWKDVKNTFKTSEMAQAIDSFLVLPEDSLLITGNCSYRFANNGWNWFINGNKDHIIAKNIDNASYMFYLSNNLKEIPFELNFIEGGCNVVSLFNSATNLEKIGDIDFKQTNYFSCASVFSNCNKLKEIGVLKNIYTSEMNAMFQYCYRLRELPKFENLNLNRIYTYANCSMINMFHGCYSLRNIPEDFVKQFYQPLCTGYYYAFLNGAFYNCCTLDEIRGLNPQTGAMTGNMFGNTFHNCHRLKDIIFATQDDGTPYSVKWKSQTIDLSMNVGWANSYNNILDYNSGITEDKKVNSVELYHELKNDPDWFCGSLEYSRYNHDSAVNTINSLPDTSAYGTNTIKFRGNAGALTDGGAINTLTEEEIAVAAAKGWTVTFV